MWLDSFPWPNKFHKWSKAIIKNNFPSIRQPAETAIDVDVGAAYEKKNYFHFRVVYWLNFTGRLDDDDADDDDDALKN